MPSDALKKLSIQNSPVSAEGLRAKNNIAEARQQVNLGATPAEASATVRQVNAGPAPRLNPTIPDVIPSTALAGNKTFEDVMDTRADLETQATAKQQLQDRIKGTGDRIGASSTPTFNDPDAMINRLLLNRAPSQTETQRTQAFDTAQQNRRDYATDISTAREQANAQFGLPDLVTRKAEVTQQYAEREAQLDADIKRIEDNASKRGVDRVAVEDMKRATKSAALEDLANYAAIEAAVSGSITEARTIINDTINDKKAAFELENQAIQQEIDYLSTLVGEDNQREATQLQFALNERKAAQDKQLAQEKEIKDLMVNVASEGADDGTINAIKNAGSVEEAIRYASPFLGRMDRQMQQAQLANIYDQINSRATSAREAALNAANTAATEQQKEQLKKTADAEQALSIKTLAESIKDMSGLNAAVGSGFKKTVIGAIPFVSGDAIAGTDRADFEAQATRLANLLTLDNLDLMSGVLSETDIKILETAGSNLRNFNQSEDSYKAEVERIIDTMNRTITNNGVTPEQAVFYGIIDKNDANTLDAIWNNL